jgi:transcriptional regulator with XRE-family HTH domain
VQRLKELRRQKVLSMRELEEMSGVSYNTIWQHHLAARERAHGSAAPDDSQDSGGARG